MDTDASTKAKDRAIDYNLYKKFWSLQDYFRNPSQCYDKQKWAAFTTNASAVLKIFAQHKLENVAMRTVTGGQDSDEENVYFPKNLTRLASTSQTCEIQISSCQERVFFCKRFLNVCLSIEPVKCTFHFAT